jgi:hypothetical protein
MAWLCVFSPANGLLVAQFALSHLDLYLVSINPPASDAAGESIMLMSLNMPSRVRVAWRVVARRNFRIRRSVFTPPCGPLRLAAATSFDLDVFYTLQQTTSTL